MSRIGLETGVAVLDSQVVPISQVVLKTGFTVHKFCKVTDLRDILLANTGFCA